MKKDEGNERGMLAVSPWVVRFSHLIRPQGTVLDLAAGRGRHARWLLSQGFRVLAVDRNVVELTQIESERLRVVQADLEGDEGWPPLGAKFDAVVVTNYLYRPAYCQILAALRPDGVLIYETFAQGNETCGRPRNPDYLLRPGELLAAFGSQLEVLAYENGLLTSPQPRVIQRICALGPERASGSAPLLNGEKSRAKP